MRPSAFTVSSRARSTSVSFVTSTATATTLPRPAELARRSSRRSALSRSQIATAAPESRKRSTIAAADALRAAGDDGVAAGQDRSCWAWCLPGLARTIEADARTARGELSGATCGRGLEGGRNCSNSSACGACDGRPVRLARPKRRLLPGRRRPMLLRAISCFTATTSGRVSAPPMRRRFSTCAAAKSTTPAPGVIPTAQWRQPEAIPNGCRAVPIDRPDRARLPLRAST